MLADAAYLNISIRNFIAFRGAKAVIANSKRDIKHDKKKEIERFFGIKAF